MSSTANVTRALNYAAKALASVRGSTSERRKALVALRMDSIFTRATSDAWNCGRGAEHDAMDERIKAEIVWLDGIAEMNAAEHARTRPDATSKAFLAELGAF